MTESDQRLAREMEELRQRIARLEARLGMFPPTRPQPERENPAPAVVPPVIERLAEARRATQPAVVVPPVRAAAPPDGPPVMARAWKAVEYRAPERPARSSAARLEGAIGARWFAWVGAVVVVIGVGLFLKLAYDRGWLNLIPPAGKCLSGAAFGLVLLAAGEVARRKINAVASAGMSAAGIGAIYASAYASHAVYGLVRPGAAFALLAASAVLGIAVAARARLVSVALLSLVGGYFVPIVMHDSPGHPAILPAYLLALLAIGLGLSGWRPRPFHLLRRPAWWGTVLLGVPWTLGVGADHPAVSLPFLCLFWGAVHLELVAASWRGGMTPHAAPGRAGTIRWRAASPILASFSTTALAASLGAIVLSHGRVLPDWMAPAAGTVVTLMVSLVLAGNLRVLRDPPRTDSQRLGAALAMQAGALLIAVIALGVPGGWMEVTAWLAMGVAAVAAGRWIGSRGLDVYGLIVLTIGAARLMLLEWWTTPAASIGVEVAGLYLTRWTALVAIAGACWLGAAALLHRGIEVGAAPTSMARPAWRSVARACIAAGLTLLMISLLHERARYESLTTVVVGLGVASVAVGAGLRSPGLRGYGALVLGLATCWVAAHGPFPLVLGGHVARAVPHLDPVELVITWWAYTAALVGMAWLAAGRLMFVDADESWRALAVVAAAIGIAAVFASILHPAASASSICLVWLALSATIVLSHAIERRLALHVLGLAGLGATAVAWAVAYVVAGWFGSTAAIGLHPGLLVAAMIILVDEVLVRWLGRRSDRGGSIATGLLPVVRVFSVALLWLATSFEAARAGGIISSDHTARMAAVSVWWGLFAAALIAFGFARRLPPVRYVGLALLGTATAKAALLDLAGVPQGWRVISFVGLGLLMLGVGVVYSRLISRLARDLGPARTG